MCSVQRYVFVRVVLVALVMSDSTLADTANSCRLTCLVSCNVEGSGGSSYSSY